jgi:violaxanthin de-epoxidase
MVLGLLQVERGEEFVEKEVEEGEKFVEEEIEEGESFFATIAKKLGQAQQVLFGRLDKGAQQLQLDQERFLQELGEEEKQLLTDLEMDASDVGKLFGNAIPIRKLR